MTTERFTLVRDAVPPAPIVPVPPAPQTLEETGLSLDLIAQLALKNLFFSGESSGADLARRMGLVFSIVEPALEFLKAQQHVEVVGGMVVGGSSYRYRITAAGRESATLFLQQSQYAGVAPVPLDQYRRYMAAVRSVRQRPITREDVRAAFSHLVLDDRVLDEIGPAIMSGHSMFIYGAPGNGKSAIARGIRGLLEGDLAIPYAIEVEGQIIRVFDPVNHEPVAGRREPSRLATETTTDQRWVICRRPMLVVGGELTMDALDLAFEPSLGYYRAPVQVQANGGVLVVDDFGRQRAAPRDLLNRWMVPLESGDDYLTLRSGLKFEVPFHVFVAFATNLKPTDLVDEAFLRRVPYKVQAADPSEENYIHIFETCCREQNVPFDRAMVQGLLDGFYHQRALPRRACQPRDLINQALRLAAYRDEPRRLTLPLLEAACRDYFVNEAS